MALELSWFLSGFKRVFGQYFMHFLLVISFNQKIFWEWQPKDFFGMVFIGFLIHPLNSWNDTKIGESFWSWIFADCKSDDVIIWSADVTFVSKRSIQESVPLMQVVALINLIKLYRSINFVMPLLSGFKINYLRQPVEKKYVIF